MDSMNMNEVFNWCDLSSNTLSEIGKNSTLGKMGMDLGKWVAGNAIPVIMTISLFTLGILLIQFMLGQKNRDHIKERLVRYAVGYVFISAVISGTVFMISNMFVSAVDGAEYKQVTEFLKQNGNDMGKARASFNAMGPEARTKICPPAK